jgi:2-aminoadipate transaminase
VSRPSVWSFDEEGETVALVQTFSKCFSPGLRVGFGILPRDLVGPVLDLKGNQDFGSTSFSQHLLATVLEDGLFASHVDHLRDAYVVKRDALTEAAAVHLGDVEGVEWLVPDGGLYVWLTVPEHVDAGFDGALFNRAVQQEQVMYVPGDLCHIGVDGVRPRNQLRLSFGVENSERLADGMARLARAIRAEL